MIVSSVRIDCSKIIDWDLVHSVFAAAFGFPVFYGQNMNAWIDCLTSLDIPEHGMTKLHCAPGTVMTLQLEHVQEFRKRCPEQFEAIVDCTAFVNWRRNDTNETSVLALSFYE